MTDRPRPVPPAVPTPVKTHRDAGLLDPAAESAQRMAVLLGAGLDPLSALRALEDPPDALAEAARCLSPYEVPEALRRAAGVWGLFAAYWEVAIEAGAPLATALERIAETLRAFAEADRQIDLALAGPQATARLVALLPLGGVAVALLVGADPLAVVFTTVPGAVSALLGVALMLLGGRWTRRLVARARVAETRAGVEAELVTLALAGGAPPEVAVDRVCAALERGGLVPRLDEVHAALAFATRAGVPVVALLRAEAVRARRIALTAALREAALLGTRLLGPLALCVLPAFVLLGVIPLMIGVLRGAFTAF